MKREEAIQCIKHELLITVNRKDLIGQAVGEALDMAITALQGGDAEVRNDRTYINEPYMQQSRHDDGRMTREDAILILGEFKEFCDRILWNSIYAERSRAIDMAIEALQAEPSGDLISREEAIETAKGLVMFWSDPVYIKEKESDVEDSFNDIPSADRPSGEWESSIDDFKICSVCGFNYCSDIAYKYFDVSRFDYCPSCGAYMRKKGGAEE